MCEFQERSGKKYCGTKIKKNIFAAATVTFHFFGLTKKGRKSSPTINQSENPDFSHLSKNRKAGDNTVLTMQC